MLFVNGSRTNRITRLKLLSIISLRIWTFNGGVSFQFFHIEVQYSLFPYWIQFWNMSNVFKIKYHWYESICLVMKYMTDDQFNAAELIHGIGARLNEAAAGFSGRVIYFPVRHSDSFKAAMFKWRQREKCHYGYSFNSYMSIRIQMEILPCAPLNKFIKLFLVVLTRCFKGIYRSF